MRFGLTFAIVTLVIASTAAVGQESSQWLDMRVFTTRGSVLQSQRADRLLSSHGRGARYYP
jgi:hypothetical protein